ncbi:MAG: ABC transporter ATP-binding protein, partial [Anaerolineae bacterium]|nr:ABC transporter ATP-binding protein [Anaerolineae bacterium]
LNPGMNLLIGASMFLVMPLFLAPSIHPALLLTPVAFIIALAVSLRVYSVQLAPLTEDVRNRFGEMNAGLAEVIDGIETVKGASQEHREIESFVRTSTAVRDAFVRQSDVEAKFVPLLLLGIAIGGAFLHAVILFSQGLIDVGQVIAYMGFLNLFGFPVWTSLFAFSQMSLGLAAGRRIYALITARTDLDANRAGHAAPIQGGVRFDNVTFQYPGAAQPALSRVSFEAKPGQVVAIVGQTGSGKSTLARLINRTFDPQIGRVLVDGVDVRGWQMEALRSQVSIIEQDIFLFSRTIAENIAFGKPGAKWAEIEAAARAAQAHDFITGFKDGYDTVVGSRGVTLSGGQRQRIALARAFLTDPRILILDDSTSAIDSATEDQIQRAIFQATRGRTTFLITHRLSQIRWADQIVVLRKGVVAAIGAHDDLLRTSEAYRRIFATYEGGASDTPSEPAVQAASEPGSTARTDTGRA